MPPAACGARSRCFTAAAHEIRGGRSVLAVDIPAALQRRSASPAFQAHGGGQQQALAYHLPRLPGAETGGRPLRRRWLSWPGDARTLRPGSGRSPGRGGVGLQLALASIAQAECFLQRLSPQQVAVSGCDAGEGAVVERKGLLRGCRRRHTVRRGRSALRRQVVIRMSAMLTRQQSPVKLATLANQPR